MIPSATYHTDTRDGVLLRPYRYTAAMHTVAARRVGTERTARSAGLCCIDVRVRGVLLWCAVHPYPP